MSAVRKARALAKIPLASLARVAVYWLAVKTGVHPVFWSRPGPPTAGNFFSLRPGGPISALPTAVWRDAPWAFGRPVGPVSATPPDWHANILTGDLVPGATRRWDCIPTYSPIFGDIKAVWEASRFDWVLSLAQAAKSGDASAMQRLDEWLQEWNERNPPYTGPNWMCGQEASIRLGRLALAARILGTAESITPALQSMVLTHLRRIAPTTAYARGQDNNHGTSEAMGLFMGGLWLARVSPEPRIKRECARYAASGRRLVENRVRRLIFPDGGFSQYSLVYHRLMLDSLSLMELWRRDWDAPPFSRRLMRAARAATEWLEAFVDPTSGDVPNLGSNDGAWLLPIGPAPIRDFRPSVALASTLYADRTHFAGAPTAGALLEWLELSPIGEAGAVAPPPSGTRVYSDSGIAMLKSGSIRTFLRFPTYRYRPHQADALHLDVWAGSENLLCDAGTYSYAYEGWEYYPSTAAHNTVEFDGRDQMPRLGRFLYGDWSRTEKLSEDVGSVTAAYTDFKGARHERAVTLKTNEIVVRDALSGNFDHATLRWHLPARIRMDGPFAVISDRLRLEMTLEGARGKMTIGEGCRSILYLANETIAAVRLRIEGPCIVTTRIILRAA